MRTGTIRLVFLLAGCTATRPDPVQLQRPVLLDKVDFRTNPGFVYDEAYTLAFEQGFQIVYSSQQERMLVMELPSADALFKIGKDWIQRVEIFVRDDNASGICYVRYYSYDPEDGNIRVVEADRAVAEAFLAVMKQRLLPPASEP